MQRSSKALFPALTFATAICVTPPALAIRCAKEADGHSSLQVNVKVTAADLRNRSNGAWEKVAAEVQRVYGRNVNVGMVSLRVVTTATLFGVTGADLIHAPFDFTGRTSIQKAVLDTFTSAPPSGPDPAPCDPDQNACCDECASEFGYAGVSEFFRSGFFTHDQLRVARMPGGTRRWSRKFQSMEIESA